MSDSASVRALIVLGVALLIIPALIPIQPVLYHDTRPGTVDNRSQIEAQGYEIISYENLSNEGQELYIRTLQEGGQYSVQIGDGASEFSYPSPAEIGEIRDYRDRNARTHIVIERPVDGQLPAADEPLHAADHLQERERERNRGDDGRRDSRNANEATPGGDGQRGTDVDRPQESETKRSADEWRQQIARYDVMETRTGLPPLEAPAALLRLLSIVAGVFALGVGGYLRSRP